jgi:hypothetical protein
MMRAVVLSLVACGPAPQYHPRAVDPLFASTFDALAKDVNKALGYTCLARDHEHGVGEIVASNRRVAEAGELLGRAIAATTYPDTRVIVMREVDPTIFPSAPMLLAHEIGHALGLNDVDTGLMSWRGDRSCIGREAACLVEALEGAP